MVAFYDSKPSKYQAVGNGSFVYRWGITQVPVSTQEGEEQRTQWQCNEVVVWATVTRHNIVAAVINATWEQNHEQKLVNEFNSAILGLITGDEAQEAKDAYTAFLNQRKTLKAGVEQDCDELGIE